MLDTQEVDQNTQTNTGFARLQHGATAAYQKGAAVVGGVREFTKDNLDAVAASGKALGTGLRDFGSSNLTAGRLAISTLTADATELASAKSPTEVVSLQANILRRNLGAALILGSKNTQALLALTSASSGEGKSSSAFAIAQNYARLGRRVLLIDSDLRKPAFKTETDDVGLSHLLTTDDPLADHVVPTQHENLSLLPSGPVPPNPADLLSTGRVRKIIAEASEQFDLVLIDAPPTLGLADSPLLAAAAGNVAFVVEAGRTRTRAVVEALNRLEAIGTHIIGIILTKASARGGGYGGYGYGYGQGYGTTARMKRTEILMIPKDSDERPAAAED